MNRKIIVLFVFIATSLLVSNNINAASNLEKCINNQVKSQKTTKAKLKVLNCSNKKVNSLKELKSLKALEELNLSNNSIKSIDSNLTNLTKLKYLDLSGNTIYYLPNSLNNLTNLKTLNLSSTYLLKLPNINKLTKLNNLYLSNNQILINPDLSKNPIKKLEIDNNFITEKSIKTKSYNIKTGKQKTLKLKENKIQLDNKNKLFTPKERIQRIVISNNNVPLYGISSYSLRSTTDEKGKSITNGDFFNMSSGKLYKSGNIKGLLNLQLDNHKYQTNLELNFNINANGSGTKSQNSEKGNSNVQSDELNEKTIKNEKEAKSALDSLSEKDFSMSEAFDFLGSKSTLILSMLLLIFTLIPFIIIVYIISRIKNAKDDIEEVYINKL